MELGFVALVVIVSIIVGVVIGIRIEKTNRARNRSGVLYVYRGELENQPPLFLESDVPMDVLASQKQAMFDVVVTR